MNPSPGNACPLAEGIDFNTLDQVKHAYRTWAVKQSFEFKTVRASKTPYEIACKGELSLASVCTFCWRAWRLFSHQILCVR